VQDQYGELTALALTGRNFGVRPSRLVKVEDERCALDFDMACTLKLMVIDNEKEKRALEVAGMGTVNNMLGGIVDRSQTVKW
jgi:hypothetical protein